MPRQRSFRSQAAETNVRMAPSFPREAGFVGNYSASLETMRDGNEDPAYRREWFRNLHKPTVEIIPASQGWFNQNVLLAIHDKPAIVFRDANGDFLREYAIYDVATFTSNGNEFQRWMLLSFYNFEAAISQATILEDVDANVIGIRIDNPMGGRHIIAYKREER